MKRKVLDMSIVLLTSILTCAVGIQQVEALEKIYIRADGSVDPPTAPISSIDNITYTFTAKLYYTISVERDNIVIDGSGYTVQGTGVYASEGISVSGRSNITIKNMKIKGFYYGIYLYRSSNVSIYQNTITESNWDGIVLEDSSGNEIYENNVADNFDGIWLSDSSNNTIFGNNMTENEGMYGVKLEHSEYNSIFGNRITHNHYGIWICESSINNIYRNELTDSYIGIYLGGTYVFPARYNMILGNNITSNGDGLSLSYSSYNTIYGNNITSNKEYGIQFLLYSSDNKIYHNNFIGNTQQIDLGIGCYNIWDDGYPSGGNYWSDYSGVDEKKGTGQDQPGSDGIGDTPYIIDADNRDRYPIIGQRQPSKVPMEPVIFYALIISVIGIVAVVVFFAVRKKMKQPEKVTTQ